MGRKNIWVWVHQAGAQHTSHWESSLAWAKVVKSIDCCQNQLHSSKKGAGMKLRAKVEGHFA